MGPKRKRENQESSVMVKRALPESDNENSQAQVNVLDSMIEMMQNTGDSNSSTAAISSESVDENQGLDLSEAVECKLCSFNFQQSGLLLMHVRYQHPDEEEYMKEIESNIGNTCGVCKTKLQYDESTHIMECCCRPSDSTIECHMCHKVYRSESLLKQHSKFCRYEKKVFECKHCASEFTEKSSLTEHMNVHEKKEEYTCEICFKGFLQKSLLSRHMKFHEEPTYFCKFCSERFHLKDNRDRHIQNVHEKGQFWQCEYCDKKFSIKGNLSQHIKGIHLKAFPFTCPNCGQGFRRKNEMELHQVKCSSGEKQSVGSSPENLNNKIISPSSNGTEGLENQVDQKTLSWTCVYCGKGFKRKGNLTQHIKGIHLKDFTFRCLKCQHGFRRKHELQSHMKRCTGDSETSIKEELGDTTQQYDENDDHSQNEPEIQNTSANESGYIPNEDSTKERPLFPTNEDAENYIVQKDREKDVEVRNEVTFDDTEVADNDSTSDSSQLDLKTTSDSYPRSFTEIDASVEHQPADEFACNICSRLFTKEKTYKCHMKTHTSAGFKCEQCGRTFNFRQNLLSHVRSIHEKNQPSSECQYCSKTFSLKSNLRQHIKGVHLKEFPYTCPKCNLGFRRINEMKTHMEHCAPNLSQLSEKDQEEQIMQPRSESGDVSFKSEPTDIESDRMFEDGSYDSNMSDDDSDTGNPNLVIGTNVQSGASVAGIADD